MPEDVLLAAIVSKPDADEAIAGLKREGCYDDGRRIGEADGSRLAIPVTRPPERTPVEDVRRQEDPARRVRDLSDLLAERGWNERDRQRAPGSWAVIGDVILARFTGCPREQAVAEALLDLHGEAHTVLAREGILGEHREPRVRVVAGRGETETVHVEDGIRYALDLAEVMFSPGNQAERRHMGETVSPGEVVLDMFAGIGYFSLPMASAGARVTAIERNPSAFAYLLENRDLNGVRDRLSPVLGDSGTVVPRLADDGAFADRVVMGHFNAPEYLSAAIPAVRPGGSVHLHAIGPADAPFAEVEAVLDSVDFDVADQRIVKSHGPGTVHVVVDGVRTAADN